MSATPQRIVIIGGVAGGASAATRARRCNERAEITLIEKDEHVSFANCGLPYHIGGEIPERGRLLVVTKELLERRFRLHVLTMTEAVAIDRAEQTVRIRCRRTGDERTLPWDRLILSTGASPVVPPVPGVDAGGVFTLRNLADMDHIVHAVQRSVDRRAVVVGAGFIGLELAEQLVRQGFEVAVVELEHQVLPLLDREMAALLEDECRRHGVALHLGDGLQQITVGNHGQTTGVELQSGTRVAASLVVLGIGVRPNTKLAEAAGIEIGASGGIAVNASLQTSDPNIYAVGDASEYVFKPTGTLRRVPLAGPANRAGRLAGEHAASGTCSPAAAVMGTAIVRVFDTSAAITGLSLRAARASGIAARSVLVVGGHHAGYFPGADQLTLKLVYEEDTGRVLGAQAVGRSGADKRIDIIATAMHFGGTVRDLSELDLAYAPPYGSAKDLVHMAGFAACNQLDGSDGFVEPGSDLHGVQVVDVRTRGEVETRPLADCPHAVNIPIDELRERLDELDPSRPTVVSCGVGIRAHLAQRILRQHGFADVANLSGGATLREPAVRHRGRP